jgi:hypothetical protein
VKIVFIKFFEAPLDDGLARDQGSTHAGCSMLSRHTVTNRIRRMLRGAQWTRFLYIEVLCAPRNLRRIRFVTFSPCLRGPKKFTHTI